MHGACSKCGGGPFRKDFNVPVESMDATPLIRNLPTKGGENPAYAFSVLGAKRGVGPLTIGTVELVEPRIS